MHPPRPPFFGRLRTGHWIAIDGLAAAGLVVLVALLDRRAGGPGGVSPAGLLVAVLAVVAAAVRRLWSARVLTGVILAFAIVTVIIGFPALWLVISYLMYYAPLRLPGREAMSLLAGTLLVAVLGVVSAVREPLAGPGGLLPGRPVFIDPVGLLVGSVMPIVIGWTIGYAMRQQRRYAASMREAADRAARERLAEARRAMSEQRLRIARELHDVVAHTLSVIAVQAGVANHVAGQRPDEARRALASIETTSKDALREMRALLGVLRGDGDPAGRPAGPPTPVPGLADLNALVERSARAGLRVDVRTTGARGDVPAGVQLAVFRLVQEALTNVIKHAATDHARVTVDCRVDLITVDVSDQGQGAAAPGRGHGITGMRERAAMYGGTLDAGPRPGGGFQVRAAIPLHTGALA